MKQPDCNQYRVETLYQNSRFGGLGVLILISVTLYITDTELSRPLLYCLVLAALGVTLYVINMTAHQRAATQPGYQPNHWGQQHDHYQRPQVKRGEEAISASSSHPHQTKKQTNPAKR